MVGIYWMIDITLALITALVTFGLLAIYMRNWRKLKTPLLLGLVAFAAIMLSSNVAAALLFYSLGERYAASVAVPLMIVQSLQLVGLSALLWATLK